MSLFERVVERMSMKDITALEETARYAIRKASMCWSIMPQGEYDNERAKQIADELIAAIRETLMEAGLSNALSNEKPGSRKKSRKDISLEHLR